MSVGGQSGDGLIQGEAFYPHVITINVGDTVAWSLGSNEPHSVTFFGAGPIPPDCAAASDFAPCPVPLPSPYDGASFAGSGLILPPAFNWNNEFPLPHGNDTFSLTFGKNGVYVYQSVVQVGMQGVVIVNPAGSPYLFTQKEYLTQARQQLKNDLAAGQRTLASYKPPEDSPGPDNTNTHYVTAGLNAPEKTIVRLSAVDRSVANGRASLRISVSSISSTLTVEVSLSGLTPGHIYSAGINYGVCGATAHASPFLLGPFALNDITAGADGTGHSSTDITTPSSGNGIQNIRIQSAGWFIMIQTNGDAGPSVEACGNVVFHNSSVMRFVPRKIHVHVGDTVVWRIPDDQNPFIMFPAGQSLPAFPSDQFFTPSGNATSYDGTGFFNSGGLFPGQSFALTFTTPGTYRYTNPLEIGMRGYVMVQAILSDD